MTTAFAFHAPRLDVPHLPQTAQAMLVAEERAMRLPRPSVPVTQAMPKQETGTRTRLA
jgi:hypothetical protein